MTSMPSSSAAKAQVVGWPPVQNYRKNTLAASSSRRKAPAEDAASTAQTMYVKIMFPSTLQGTGENWTMMKTICVTEYLNYEGDYMPLQPLEDENDTVISFLYPLEPPVKQGRTRRGRFQSQSGQLFAVALFDS
ncbi:putative methionine--tRNA ligase [Zea mays]|uniref:Auxin-responsive protein n=1 Tax=Zea mays TaxID=4577 RepID=A0A3L6DKC4_MAIZE|nr:putative methionine--tRNA ligase [Zea mays]